MILLEQKINTYVLVEMENEQHSGSELIRP